MQKLFLVTASLLVLFMSAAYAKEVSFTQEDRDRIIRLEEGLKATNQRIDTLRLELKEDISDLKTFMLWGFGILFGGMGILIGFVIWDRRTALSPVVRKNRELE
ncbi:MAG: hypothetical protein HZA07_00935, partial [Nitrospirae bacterium]|nr:hypothetical protein [Nitrospirota bacterium]